MTQDMVKALNDGELEQVIVWAQDEQKARAERRKRETIARIKELARTVGVSLNIRGTRGRPIGHDSTPREAKIQITQKERREVEARELQENLTKKH
jgi:hypothetical protein